ALVRARSVRPHCQCGIKQEHTLVCPRRKVAMVRYPEPRDIRGQLLVHVAQRGWYTHARRNGKGQAVSLPYVMVRVLPQDDHVNRVKGGVVERIENKVTRWINRMFPLFCHQELFELPHISLFKLGTKYGFPTRFQLYTHTAKIHFIVKCTCSKLVKRLN